MPGEYFEVDPEAIRNSGLPFQPRGPMQQTAYRIELDDPTAIVSAPLPKPVLH